MINREEKGNFKPLTPHLAQYVRDNTLIHETTI